ncbi:hypothetical protein D3C72_1786880 [compost metagenome]
MVFCRLSTPTFTPAPRVWVSLPLVVSTLPLASLLKDWPPLALAFSPRFQLFFCSWFCTDSSTTPPFSAFRPTLLPLTSVPCRCRACASLPLAVMVTAPPLVILPPCWVVEVSSTLAMSNAPPRERPPALFLSLSVLLPPISILPESVSSLRVCCDWAA